MIFAACLSEVSSKKYLARLDKKSSAKDVVICRNAGYRLNQCCIYRFGTLRGCYYRRYLVSEKLKSSSKNLVVCKRGKSFTRYCIIYKT